MKIILNNSKFQLVNSNNEVIVNDISFGVEYYSKTYTFDPIAPIGEFKTETNGTLTKFICDNYVYEVKNEGDNIAVRVYFKNITNETLTRNFYVNVFSGLWKNPFTHCIYNEVEMLSFELPNTMGSIVKTIKFVDNQSVIGTDFVSCHDVDDENHVFGFATANEYFGKVSINEGGKIRGWQTLEFIDLLPGEEVQSDWFYISSFDNINTALEDYGDILAKYGNVKQLPEVPAGWCTWYYYMMHVDQEEIITNLDYLKTQKEKLPIKYIQIDDGWYDHVGDWFENEKFSMTMKKLADDIKAEGYLPGIWLCPFSVTASSKVFKEHPEYMVMDDDLKTPYKLPNAGFPYALDTTNEETREYLTNLFKRLSYDWGFKYIKLDYVFSCVQPGKRKQRNVSTAKALRMGYETIKAAVADDTFILGCTSPIAPAIGLVDGMRIGVDIFNDWHSLIDVFSRINKRYFYHNKAFINDADCILIRKSENEDDRCMRLCTRTDNELEVFATCMAASGGILMLSDKMPLLKENQIDLLSKLFPLNTQVARPLDLWDCDCPSVLDFGTRNNTRIIALINWTERKKVMTADFNKGYVFEFWKQEFLGEKDNISVEIEPHSVKLYFVTNKEEAVVVGTDCCICPEIEQLYKNNKLTFKPLKDNSNYIIAISKNPIELVGCELVSKNSDYLEVKVNSADICEIIF